jgi:hypothetical protein
MIDVGQVPIVVRREVDGFILNRLQGALLSEAMRLVGEGYVSTEDLDKTVRDGLGLRWSFMGPFETIDLNAPAASPTIANATAACTVAWPPIRPGPTCGRAHARPASRPRSARRSRHPSARREPNGWLGVLRSRAQRDIRFD